MFVSDGFGLYRRAQGLSSDCAGVGPMLGTSTKVLFFLFSVLKVPIETELSLVET